MSQELNLASDDELLEEIYSRYHTVVFGLWRPTSKDISQAIFKLRWQGDSFTAAGLCSAIQEEINKDRRDNESEHDHDS